MPAEKKRILIVEDEKPMARALQLKLEHTGFEVDVTFDGEAGLDALDKERYDLVILDLVMPKMDGFKVLAALKERKNATPVIVISNLGQEEDIRRAKELGAREYFVKSNTSLADIIKHIKKTIS